MISVGVNGGLRFLKSDWLRFDDNSITHGDMKAWIALSSYEWKILERNDKQLTMYILSSFGHKAVTLRTDKYCNNVQVRLYQIYKVHEASCRDADAKAKTNKIRIR